MIRRIFRPERFTGWHMVGVLGLFFGTIIAVNAVLAILASGSWSGLVVKNTYVASQEYNEKLAAADRQAARGWSGSFEYGEAGRIVFTLVDRDGEPVLADTVRVSLRRPAYESADHGVTLQRKGDGRYALDHPLKGGLWHAEVEAALPGDTAWRKIYRFVAPAADGGSGGGETS